MYGSSVERWPQLRKLSPNYLFCLSALSSSFLIYQQIQSYGAKVIVPGGVDMLIAGTSCVDYSNLNNQKQDIEAKGESGETFRGMLNWVKKHRPPVVILENVCGAVSGRRFEVLFILLLTVLLRLLALG